MDTKQKKNTKAPSRGSRSKTQAKRAGSATKPRKETDRPKKAGRPAAALQTGIDTAKTARRKSTPSTERRVSQRNRTQQVARKPRKTQRRTPVQPAVEQQAAPEVVYTQAKPFNRNRLILQLASVVAVVLALSFGISIFFKVENVTVSGNQKYSAWTVQEASGITKGDSLLAFGKAKASGKITAALPYVESVRIGIKLPNTVNIEIKELDVVYSIKDISEMWWLITAQGRIVERATAATAGEYTTIQGVRLASAAPGQQAVAHEVPAATDAEGNTLGSAVRGSDRLTAALSILQFMEQGGIIGDAASVNVEDLGNIELWYGQRYQVLLGDTTQLEYKINCMNSAINGTNSLKEYDSGVLDISFFIKKDQIVYEPFS